MTPLAAPSGFPSGAFRIFIEIHKSSQIIIAASSNPVWLSVESMRCTASTEKTGT
jgi:hypothetical protein